MSEPFRSQFSSDIFLSKYDPWGCLTRSMVESVCGGLVPRTLMREIEEFHAAMKFIAGGRYLYYAGRPAKYYNNCYLLRCEEDTREDWAETARKATSCLMTGGGIGFDYSRYRAKGGRLSRTGGVASGPIPAMEMVNEIGRRVMQGGSRRSAIYASLSREHPDVLDFLGVKDWDSRMVAGSGLSMGDLKKANFDFPCPLDHTNISVNYSDEWLAIGDEKHLDLVFLMNCEYACRNGEPGFSFNFGEQANETLRNACTEVVSEDDSDVCNLASVNMARIESLDEFRRVVSAATRFLVCGTLRADLPYEKVKKVREKNRRLGLGLMGVHEWLLQRGYRYEPNEELAEWLAAYESESRAAADDMASALSVSRPVACRAIAPTGTIGILAGTTTGIEPLYAVAYKRRYMKGNRHCSQYVVDAVAKSIVERTGVDPDSVETATDLAKDVDRRLAFQAFVQQFVDMAISSTINLPAWGSDGNNEDTVRDFAKTLAKHAPNIRGFTCYPDGARGGQPLTRVPYAEAMKREGAEVIEEASDVCSITGKGGFCGS